MILVDAVFINNSGGEVLLKELLSLTSPHYEEFHFLLDHRFVNKHRLNNSLNFQILSSEKERYNYYNSISSDYSIVFCFNNIPPPKKINQFVIVYFHNLLLTSPRYSSSFIKMMKYYLKHFYIRYLINNVDEIHVQTDFTKQLVSNNLGFNKTIKLFPFYKIKSYDNKRLKTSNNKNFFYPAGGNPHKNHLTLIKSWEQIQEIHKDAVLYLTIGDNSPKLIELINTQIKKGLKIVNLGIIDHEEVYNYYNHCRFVIFPSQIESLGLPLIEAAMNENIILVSNQPYSSCVVDTKYTFNSQSPTSIVNCVDTVLNIEKPSPAKLKIETKGSLLINYLRRICLEND